MYSYLKSTCAFHLSDFKGNVMHGLLPGFLQTINNVIKEPTRVFVVIGLSVLSALFSVKVSATEYGEYEEFGLGAFRERLFSQMESYDPYSGKVNFVHHDASIRSSSSLSVNFNRRFLNKLDTYGAHAGDWALSFGMVQNVSGFPSGEFCDQVLSRPFITPSGMIKEFVASLDIMRPSSPAIYQLVSTDGWRAYCWYAGNVPASYQYQEGNNPRGRDEVVFQSPDGTKYIVGQKFSRTTYPGSGGSSYGGNTEWLVTRV
ncbi:MAG: hypothetical protein R3309_13525, partial [Reinekea sp.]|nr:hypothetical protein [Reinekea sp.]